jgi:hypothetical protein
MDYVRYIDRTRDYYRSQGYKQDYQWALYEEVPFAPLDKPVSQCRAMIVSTASMVTLDESGNPLESPKMMGGPTLEVTAISSDWPVERLRSTSEDHDRAQTDMSDIDAFFPITRLRELAEEGAIASVAGEHQRMLPNYSKRKTERIDAPEVLRRARADEVDIALLCPV